MTPDGLFRLGREAFRCALGRGGIRADKREGDGATPVGDLPLRRVLYRADRVATPACRVPVEPLSPSDGKEMAAQLAQFTSVEQLQSANDTLAQIRDAFKAAQQQQP